MQVDELMFSGVVVFCEFISQRIDLSCTSYMIVGFILALRYKDNKPLVIYRNIKSQDDLIIKICDNSPTLQPIFSLEWSGN